MKQEYKDYLDSREWKVVRRIALNFADYRCQICNSDKLLEVHHRTYQNIGAETLSDVVVLCEQCHNLFHEKKERLNGRKCFVEKSGKEDFISPPKKNKNDADLRLDIEDLLENGKDYIGILGVNRFEMRKLMENYGIDMKYHTKVCDVLDKKNIKNTTNDIDFILKGN